MPGSVAIRAELSPGDRAHRAYKLGCMSDQHSAGSILRAAGHYSHVLTSPQLVSSSNLQMSMTTMVRALLLSTCSRPVSKSFGDETS